jgi:hypothetical protein
MVCYSNQEYKTVNRICISRCRVLFDWAYRRPQFLSRMVRLELHGRQSIRNGRRCVWYVTEKKNIKRPPPRPPLGKDIYIYIFA